MGLYLGLDCGGTKTHAVVTDEGGTTVFEGRSGPANLATTPPDVVARHLQEALKGAPRVEAACGAFAGLLGPEDAKKAEWLLTSLLGTKLVSAVPDFHAAWELARKSADVLVISGTGVLVCSEHEGKAVKSGGGGVLFGDEGSAASVGRYALHGQVVSASPVRATMEFWNQVKVVFGTKDTEEVVRALYKSDAPASMFAAMAEVVARDARKGEAYAEIAVQTAMGRLKEEVLAHVVKFQAEKLPRVRVALMGGTWLIHPIFLERFTEGRESRTDSEWEYKVLNTAPALGACQLARKLAP